MRLFLLLLWAPAVLAAPVTFDFEWMPDSVPCSEPTSTRSPFILENCGSGYDTVFNGFPPYTHTVDGLTMDIRGHNGPSMISWIGGVLACGNAPECLGYMATFSTPLSNATVEFTGISLPGPDGNPFHSYEAVGYLLSAYEGAFGTGALVGEVFLPGTGPATLHLTLGDTFQSIVMSGIVAVSEGDTILRYANRGAVESLTVSALEPGSLALLASGLLLIRRRRAA